MYPSEYNEVTRKANLSYAKIHEKGVIVRIRKIAPTLSTVKLVYVYRCTDNLSPTLDHFFSLSLSPTVRR